MWVRYSGGGGDVIICAVNDGGLIGGPATPRTTRGTPAINDDHFPGSHPKTPGDYRIWARTIEDRMFLAIGRAQRPGSKKLPRPVPNRCGSKWSHAVELAALGTPADVDWALGYAAVHAPAPCSPPRH